VSQPNHAVDCACCAGLSPKTPVEIANRPGLDAIAYRVGTHSRFKQSILARLSTSAALRGIDARNDQDFTVALVDAFAVMADILSFYDERIANESYLRTATERLSLNQLARLIGYEPRPGAAASAHLAFTVEDAPGSPERAVIDAGTRVQSVPGPNELPQTFETVERIEARAAWNALKARATRPQAVKANAPSLLVAGLVTRLQAGDATLLVEEGVGGKKALRRVARVEVDPAAQQTAVVFESDATTAAAVGTKPDASPAAATPDLFEKPLAFTGKNVLDVVRGRRWTQADLAAFTALQGWSMDAVIATVKAHAPGASTAADAGAFALRVRASPFGYNAPDWQLLPGPPSDVRDKVANTKKDDWKLATRDDDVLDLDAVYPSIAPGSWAAVGQPSSGAGAPPTWTFAKVVSRTETGVAAYGMGGRVTEIKLDQKVTIGDMATLRRTIVYAESDRLALAEVPITDPVEGSKIELATMVGDLRRGQPIAVTGERADAAGVVASEIGVIGEIVHADGRTTIELLDALAHPYRRSTVTLNANVAPATHGESREEVIGSGDASQPFQRFPLRQPPLTHVSSPASGGVDSTLEIRVDDLLWIEAPSFYGRGPNDRVYVTRTADDGTTVVQFGDGVTGARLPTGQENVRATYRKGIGVAGMVDAGQLSLLLTRPLGVRGVTNPLAASGGADRESRDEIRENASLAILALNRIVSLRDYEDFARAFAGIGKASATWAWDGEKRVTVVTVADARGAPLDPSSQLLGNLLAAVRKAGDPTADVRVVPYRKALFRVSAGVRIDPLGPPAERVLAAVEGRLRARFSAAARAFGQGVARSEVLAAFHEVPGVVGADLDAFHRADAAASLADVLFADGPSFAGGDARGAELLALDVGAVALKEMS
jgi:predicted phage baseplate assembly protein